MVEPAVDGDDIDGVFFVRTWITRPL